MTEAAWSQRLEILRSEVVKAIQSFYTWKHINNYAAANPIVLKRMQQNSTFWNITVYALQTTFIITTGRLFDKDPRSSSIQKFLAEMASHPDYFSKQSLERRKCEATRGGNVSWLPDYLRDVWEPTTPDLEQLRDTINPTIEKYEQVYQPIRHKMFAHTDIAVDRNALLKETIITDIERILYTLYDTIEAVWQLYMNGMKPTLGVREYDDESRISKTTRRVMTKLTTIEKA